MERTNYARFVFVCLILLALYAVLRILRPFLRFRPVLYAGSFLDLPIN